MRPKIDEILADPFFFKRHVPSHLNCSALFEVPAAEVINSPKKSPSRKRKLSLEEAVSAFNLSDLGILLTLFQSDRPASKICKFDSNTSPTQGNNTIKWGDWIRLTLCFSYQAHVTEQGAARSFHGCFGELAHRYFLSPRVAQRKKDTSIIKPRLPPHRAPQ